MTGDPEHSPRPDGVRVTAAKCVRCGKLVMARYRPFCSQRCADIDLGEWLKGTYRVPTTEEPEVPDEPAPREPEPDKP